MSGNDRRGFDPEGLNTGAAPRADRTSFLTPSGRFFTRSHAPVPAVAPDAFRLAVDGLVDRPLSLSLSDLLGRFPQRTLEATLVCAGLRRAEFAAIGPLNGELPWGLEPAGNGRWSGPALADVLAAAGIEAAARHVEFTGLDEVERGGLRFPFGGSVDLDKALTGDVLLATDLNGAPLPPAHGFPLRAVVPGWIGARSVKWLGRITVRDTPSDNYFFTKAYRILRDADADPERPLDVSTGTAMSEVPLNALIVDPAPGARIAAGPATVRGWAIGTGGSPITGVDVSLDGGNGWIRARTAGENPAWSWTFWEATVDLKPGRHALVVRAFDAAGSRQPARLEDTANVKGYGNNAWHRVEVEVV